MFFDGVNFGCRHCLNLTYQSQKKSRKPISLLLDEVLSLEKSYVKICNSMRKTHYKGKPTRKFKKLQKIGSRLKELEPISQNIFDDVMSKRSY